MEKNKKISEDLPHGITQNVEELLKNDRARLMLGNSELIIMLNQSSTDREQLANLLHISDMEMKYITNVNSGEGLIKIRNSLIPQIEDIPLHIFKTIDSTNLYINRIAAEGAPEWSVCACEEQTHGSRRSLEPFLSPSGKGVYVSVLLRPDILSDKLKDFPETAAECTAKAVKKLTGIDTSISNGADLYYDGKQLCGILSDAMVECATSKVRHVTLGIGVRVYGSSESEEISIFDITNKYCNRSELIAEILNYLYTALNS